MTTRENSGAAAVETLASVPAPFDGGVRTWTETVTGDGQFVEFSCRPDDVNFVKQAMLVINTIEQVATKQVLIVQGGYGNYTRFDVTQHGYMGGGHPRCGGFLEMLEI